MLGTGGAASSSAGEVIPASSSGGEPPVSEEVAAALQLIEQIGLEEPPPPGEDDRPEVVSGAPAMARRPVFEKSEPVPHRGLLRLRQSFCAEGACQVLDHSITGEVVRCDMQCQWKLHFSGTSGIGYIVSDMDKLWVNKLLKCFLHKCNDTGDDFVVQRVTVDHLDSKTLMFWLTEWQHKLEPHWISWHASPGVPKLPIAKVDVGKGLGFKQPKTFWTPLEWFQAAECSTDKSTFSKQLQRFKRSCTAKYPELDLRIHMREGHVVGVDKRFGGRQPKCSTLALLLFLLDLAIMTDNNVDALHPVRLILGLSKYVFDHCLCRLQRIMSPDDPEAWQEHAVMLMGDKVLFMDSIPGVRPVAQEATLPELLVQCFASSPTFVYDFLAEVAEYIDDALPYKWLTSCRSLMPAILASRPSARSPLDIDVVQELRSLQSSSEMRTVKQMNRNLRGLGLPLHGGDHFLDTASCRRLALASCRSFHGSTGFGLAVDCKRFGGKHWLAGIVSSTDKLVATVANPVAHCLLLLLLCFFCHNPKQCSIGPFRWATPPPLRWVTLPPL